MKKVLVGCGVVLAVGLVLLGVGGYLLGRAVKDVAGDAIEAAQLADRMPLDRMDQEAVDVDPAAMAAQLPNLLNRPVRLTGVVMDPGANDAPGTVRPPPPGPNDPNMMMFLEPGVLVTFTGSADIPKGNIVGRRYTVLGIASRARLDKLMGMTDESRAKMRQRLGSTDLPIIVTRRIDLAPAK